MLSLQQIRELYNQGQWEKAEEELLETMKHMTDDLLLYLSAIVLLGWIAWKRGNKSWAHNLWASVYDNESIAQADRISAMCGLAIYHSGLKTDNSRQRTLSFADEVKSMLEDFSGASAYAAVQLNNLAIALYNAGETQAARDILSKAMEMNEAMEKSDDEKEVAAATLRRAKNGYVYCVSDFMPRKDYEKALEELLIRVIPRYRRVKADSDRAAAYHQVSVCFLATADDNVVNLDKALDYELESSIIWKEHLEDDPKRFERAEANLEKIETLIAERDKKTKQ